MEKLKQKICTEGQAIGTEIIKVDSFLNHQIDAQFMYEIGEEFKKRFHDDKVTKILTIEASGIAIAVCTAKYFDFPPVVFAKKSTPSTMVDGFYTSEAKSFTKGTVSHIRIAKKFLIPDDQVLIIDDFLAHGEAALALCDLVEQAGAHVVGIGTVIDKEFQGGSAKLRKNGYRVEALAAIQQISDGTIVFS